MDNKLFTRDLYRNFGIGFVAGAIVVAMSQGGALVSALPQMLASLA